ncbi:histidinol phosphate phosphatase [Clostridium paraputrificum]|uniref:histidinol phosphate phosphatase n=1 Tax=Clostridium paraputrificum TaxID=29363 RepID=UPI003D34ED1D
MIFDSHMHTEFSSDSRMKIQEVIEKANNLNIGVVLTEHLDLAYPEKDEFRVNPKDYFTAYNKYRNDKLLLGIEIGLSLSVNKENSIIANSNPFDFIIGSIHAVNDEDIYLTYGKEGVTKDEYFKTYLEYMLKCIQDYKDFDALGHIDYPCRYCPFDNKELIYNEKADILDEVFKSLIDNGKVMEINTARIDNKESFMNLVTIYTRYRELGGKYITIGSDAHNQNNIGRNFNEAFNFLDITGLKGIYYKERKPEFIK